eukprot:scaffold447_cov307-Pinguiococcus_pyrenoidosus.AAC.54
MVLDGVVRATLDEELAERAGRLVGHRIVQRGVAGRVLVIHVGTATKQHLHELLIDLLNGDQQESVALLVLGVDGEAKVEALAHALYATIASLREDRLQWRDRFPGGSLAVPYQLGRLLGPDSLELHLLARGEGEQLCPCGCNLLDVKLVLDSEHISHVGLSQLDQEASVDGRLLEGALVLRQPQRVQPSANVLDAPQTKVRWEGLLDGLAEVICVLLSLLHFLLAFPQTLGNGIIGTEPHVLQRRNRGGGRRSRRGRRHRGGGAYGRVGGVLVDLAQLLEHVEAGEVAERHAHELELEQLFRLGEHAFGALFMLSRALSGGCCGCRRGRRRGLQHDSLLAQRVQLVLLLLQELHEVSLQARELPCFSLASRFHVAHGRLQPLQRTTLPLDRLQYAGKLRLQLSPTRLSLGTLGADRQLQGVRPRRLVSAMLRYFTSLPCLVAYLLGDT